MEMILKHFEVVDPVMAELARKHALKPRKRNTKNRFEYLALTILYQQLSTKVADVIAGRFRAMYQQEIIAGQNPLVALAEKELKAKSKKTKAGTAQFPEPDVILATPDERLRSIGISWSKIKYIKDLADKVASKQVNIENLEQLSDEEVIAELTKVKGIGRWTAEMFLMSALDRPDIFSFGDFGLQTAIKRAYGLRKLPSKQTMHRLSRKWSPYRTYAARVLWASLDND